MCVDYSRNTRLLYVDINNTIESVLAGGGGRGKGKTEPSARDATLLMVVHGGRDDGEVIPISKPKVTMGRFPDNDILVEGTGVSGRHAEILATNDGHFLRRLDAVNATFVNRREIGNVKYLLQHGDRIQLAYSTVTHVIAGTQNRLVNPTLGVSYEELLGRTAGSGESLADVDNYEGTVRLHVDIEGQIKLVISFVTELRLNSRLRMLRLVGNPPENVDIWISLREPMPLRQILDRMEEVAEVNGPPRIAAAQPGQVAMLEVRLNAEFGRNAPGHRFRKTDAP